MPHFLGAQWESRLKAHRQAWEHFQKFSGKYLDFAKKMREATKEYDRVGKSESQIFMVKAMIIEYDQDLWGLAAANPILTADQIAECYARLVVGHAG